ncbi:MAG: hypothetical protein AB7G04_04355 [Hyphomonadaceae bacterium]
MDAIVSPEQRQAPDPEAAAALEAQLVSLVDAYRRTLAEAAKLPMFSIWPSLVVVGYYLLVYPGFLIDVVLIPYNLAVLIARKFGAQWRFIAPATKRIKYAARYFWRGEVSFGAVIMRPAVRWLVRGHVANRLPKLAELLYLCPAFDEATRFRLLEWMERERRFWVVQDLTQVSLKGTVPTLVLAAGTYFWNQFEDGDAKNLLQVYAAIFGVVIGYFVITLFLGSFPTKRGLFLGRPAKRAWAPGGVKEPGLYAQEAALFKALGGRSREVPIDGLGTLSGSLASLALLAIAYAPPEAARFVGGAVSQAAGFYRMVLTYGAHQSPEYILVSQLSSAVVAVLIFCVALRRRSVLHRS